VIKKFLAMLVASLSLLTATTAQATSAQALSLGNSPAISRAASDAGDGNELTGGSALGYVLLAVVAGAMIWGLVEIIDDSDSN
jgi:hypothetical protein